MRVYQPTRGGSWYDRHGPRSARASCRYRLGPSDRYELYGFRCALIVWRR